MNSRTDPKSDEQLATAIRSAFDDIVVATENHALAQSHTGSEDETTHRRTSDDLAGQTEVADDAALPGEVVRGRSDRSRWLLSAAAVVILTAGVGALTMLDNRGSELEDPASASLGNTVPTSDQQNGYRYAEALPAETVPFLEPAPAQPETVDRPRSTEWVSGITGFSLFGVRHDDQPAASVIVLETEVPWDVISAGLPTETIGGTDAVIVRTPDETGLFLKNGATTRAVFDTAITAGDDDPPVDVSPEAREVGDLVAGQSLDAVIGSTQVVQITSLGVGPTAVGYGPETDPETVLFRTPIPVSMSDDDVPLAAELVSAISLAEGLEGLAFERVSPTDLIVVAAADRALADDALAAVQFDERPSTTSPDQELVYDQVVARGEPSWGRWQLATGPDDPSCWMASATIWGPNNFVDEAGNCRDAGAAETVPTTFCLFIDDRIIGASLDSDAVFDFQSEQDPDGFEASIEQTGETVSFQVLGTGDRTDIPEVEITVDGEPLDCSI